MLLPQMGKHAYLIICHNNWTQLEFLIDILSDSRNDFFVLVDSKAKDFDKDDFIKKCSSQRIYFAKSLRVYWGDYSQVDAYMSLLRTATEHAQYDYYHLISGVDMPLKNQEEIHRFFDEHKGTEFVDFYRGDDHSVAVERMSYFYFFQKQIGRKQISFLKLVRDAFVKIQKVFGVNRVKEIEQYLGKGSNWFSITDGFARYIVENANFIQNHFRYTYASDEVFVQTMLNMSPFKENWYGNENKQIYYRNLRLTDWKRGKPYTFRKDEYFELCQSPYLFARKFGNDIISDDVKDYLKAGEGKL